MTFCTAINCLDGRVQKPAFDFLTKFYNVNYVDMITEAGPVQYLAEQQGGDITAGILRRVDISIRVHDPVGIAVIAHHDCRGNPVSEQKQKEQLKLAVDFLQSRYENIPVTAFWINSDWQVDQTLSGLDSIS